MGATSHVHVHNNSSQPLIVMPAVGEESLQFKPGWSRVQSQHLARVTGGFDRKGKAKGGVAARYFNDLVEFEPGKPRPYLHVGTPANGEPVQEITAERGIRSNHRLSRRREQDAVIADLQRQVAMLTGARVQHPTPAQVDLSGLEIDAIKAAIKDLDTPALERALGAEVAGRDRPAVVKLLKSRIKKG